MRRFAARVRRCPCFSYGPARRERATDAHRPRGARHARVRRRFHQPHAAAVPPCARLHAAAGRPRVDGDAARLGVPVAGGRALRDTHRVSPGVARCRAAHVRHGRGVCRRARLLAAAGRRVRRHAQSLERRRQRVPAAGACGALGHRQRGAAHERVRALQPRGRVLRRAGCVACRLAAGAGRRPAGCSARCAAIDVRVVRCTRPGRLGVVSPEIAYDLALLALFRKVRPPEEARAPRGARSM